MKARILAGICAGVVLATSPARAGLKFIASLDGTQSGTGSSATGSAALELSDDKTALSISVTVEGLDFDGSATFGTEDNVTAFHIHRAKAGVVGPVVFGFISPNSDTNGQFNMDVNGLTTTITSVWDGVEGNGTTLSDEISNLLSEGLYFNVHTNSNPGGEIRGQVTPEPASLTLLGIGGLVVMCRRRV